MDFTKTRIAALLFTLLAASACAGVRPPGVLGGVAPPEPALPPPPAPLTPQQRRRATEDFARAVHAYEVELGALGDLPTARRSTGVPRAIDRLAGAIAVIPLRGGLDLGDATGRMKRLSARLSTTSSQAEWMMLVKQSLEIAVANLHLAGSHPYANAPSVEASITNFDYGVAGIDAGSSIATQLPYIMVALRGADMALQAIAAASPALE